MNRFLRVRVCINGDSMSTFGQITTPSSEVRDLLWRLSETHSKETALNTSKLVVVLEGVPFSFT